LIAKGVQDANRRLAKSNWPRLGHLHLIELYLDRATEAWRALRMQEEGAPANYTVSDVIEIGPAGLVRPPDQGYRGSEYDFLSAVTPANAPPGVIEYTLDTRRARSEVRAQITQSKLIETMVERASNDKNNDPRIGNTLCRLLLPLEMDPFIGGTSELLIELDAATAAIPWELLDTDTPEQGDVAPWSIRSKLVRKLRTDVFRERVRDADLDSSALVIGEPLVNSGPYPPLPGAREEAATVAQRLMQEAALGPERVTALMSSDDPPAPGPTSQAVMNVLFDKGAAWRIVHIAGHGEPAETVARLQQKPGDPPQTYGGVVLSDNTFLGPNEIRSMRVVPELVFVNCCHLAAFTPERLLESNQRQPGDPYNRSRFASGVAEELIKIGVRCVVAAGWAVDDGPAKVFADKFYEAVLGGHRFIEAVAIAREAAWHEGGNTWAAYQCYGDPEWTFRVPTDPATAQRRDGAKELAQKFAGVASPFGLVLALDALSVESRFHRKKHSSDVQQMRIRYLEERFWQRWSAIGRVAEAFANAWKDAGNRPKAIECYQKALEANDGSASIRAAEQLGNLLVRQAEMVLTGVSDETPAEPPAKPPRKSRAKGVPV
jgi:hypothetical protein